MIVKMKKVFAATTAARREALLDALRELGVVHLEPAAPGASAPAAVLEALAKVQTAQQVISTVKPGAARPEVSALAAAEEIHAIARRAEENRARLSALGREADGLALWGELRRESLNALEAAGVPLEFYAVPAREVGAISAELAAPLAELPGKRTLVAVVDRPGAASLPEGSQRLEKPPRDIFAVRREAQEVDSTLAADARRLAELAGLADELEKKRRELADQAAYEKALAGAKLGEGVFAVQGWVPVELADELPQQLTVSGLAAVAVSRDPLPEESPPTLLRPAWWARPAAGLLQALDTVPGYREVDVSWMFMLALPVFAAVLIGDAGYGLIFLTVPALLYRKMSLKIGSGLTQLLLVFGALSLIWGVLTGSFFGVSGTELSKSVWPFRWIGQGMEHVRSALGLSNFAVDLGNKEQLMRLCFIVAAIHLSAAHLLRARRNFPNIVFLSFVGWAIVLWGMYGYVVKFVLNEPAEWPQMWSRPWPYLLIVGLALAVCFGMPSRNPFKAVGLGAASAIFPLIGTFGDSVSYLRLMAIALAGSMLASQFNLLAWQTGTWLLAVPILVAGHALNIALTMIALVAHAVRLNILEFSNNLGMEWSGYSYRPFAKMGQEKRT